MSVKFEVEGLRELEANLKKLKTGTGRGVMSRTLKKAAKPLAVLIAQYAPDDPNTATDDLEQSILITSKLSRKARRSYRRDFKGSTAVELFVGPSTTAFYGFFQEFGTVHHAPQPFVRPAWDQDKEALVGRIKDQLGVEIQKTLNRLAKAKG